ncbi:MAG: D-alanine--D-alanine ligase [Waddliaceae bacterium]|nr:D-alanine--D-alanine ligase [Waddliaceae bacterium]MBT3579448.1 D-alanine--D-alanine ligase [Waddliaceae bacterium]MBT4444992.1 D-alanine--D-alanine ligase [Waddliaceae bacterium]MBT6928947.1 D-alanine--D-alanine ligase [Waddliaceae bacterium]MBT7264467.1 D-alanine--D-alanine ligase [Waddliaceae bacterium]
MKKKQIAVLFGGRSVEHEISIITALQLIEAMDTTRYDAIPVYVDQKGKWYCGEKLYDKDFYRTMPGSLKDVAQVTLMPHPRSQGLTVVDKKNKTIPVDVYLLAFHGQYGEDGCVQGLLELADAPYTGCDVMASSLAMNKEHCKAVLKAHDIPVLPGIRIKRDDAQRSFNDVRTKIFATKGLETFPLFVKPCHLGSSVGIGKASDMPSLNAALANAFKYDTEIIVEKCVEELLEVNISVIEGDTPKASAVEIPISSGDALSYEDKYLRGGKNKGKSNTQGMAGLTRDIDPQNLDVAIKEKIREYALKAYDIIGCGGVVRFDFMVDTANDAIYFNELNPIPGSMAYYLWEKTTPRILYTEMIDIIIQGAERRKTKKKGVQEDFGFKALKK